MAAPGRGDGLSSASADPGQAANGGTGTGLVRHIGLLGLAATGICSMVGAGINVVPIMIQRNVPGIANLVMPAFVVGAIAAVLAGLVYAILASAMPRAGGSYVYASRALSPYLGFVASFSQWFGLSIVIGVVAYLVVPFIRDVVAALGLEGAAAALDSGAIRVGLSLAILWLFVGVNLRGVKLYERTIVPLMFVMFALGGIVVFAGFAFDQADFANALLAREGARVPDTLPPAFRLTTFLQASAILFASFVGFEAVAQAGGEAKNPNRNMPIAIGTAVLVVGAFYLLFTAAVYHTVPWAFVAERAQSQDLTAPGLLGYVLPTGWTIAIVAGAAIALINDLPAMLLSVSRLMFAWAEDGIFPRRVARVHPEWHTPHVALLLSGVLASVGILGSHLRGDFFLGVDIMVTSMLVNFLLMSLSVLALPRRNPEIARDIGVLPNRRHQVPVAGLATIVIAIFLVVQVWKDVTADVSGWYFHSTLVWLLVMAIGTLVYVWEVRKLKESGVDTRALFRALPPE